MNLWMCAGGIFGLILIGIVPVVSALAVEGNLFCGRNKFNRRIISLGCDKMMKKSYWGEVRENFEVCKKFSNLIFTKIKLEIKKKQLKIVLNFLVQVLNIFN